MLLLSCKSNKDIENVYNVTVDQNNPTAKLVLIVTLLDRINKVELEAVSNELYERYYGEDYGSVFFSYYLINMEVNNGSYARTQFNPKESQIIGLTEEEKNKIIDHFNISGSYWIDDHWQIIMQIKNEGNNHYMKKYAVDFSSSKELVNKSVRNRDTILKIPDAEDGAYYLLDENNELSIFDSAGYINKFLKE